MRSLIPVVFVVTLVAGAAAAQEPAPIPAPKPLTVEERLAARQLDERRVQVEGGCEDFESPHPLAAVEGLRGVAPGAAKVAACEADEGARDADEGRFALDALVDLVDDEGVLFHGSAFVAHARAGDHDANACGLSAIACR